jgi:hypothetical protein
MKMKDSYPVSKHHDMKEYRGYGGQIHTNLDGGE